MPHIDEAISMMSSPEKQRSLDFERLLGDLATENELLREDLQRAREEREALLNSTSWRLTAPLRALIRRLPHLPSRGGAASPLGEAGYGSWFKRYQSLTGADRRAISSRIDGMDEPPLLSLVLTVAEEAPAPIAATLASLQRQLYRRWELCLCDDASVVPGVARMCGTASQDRRVKVVRLPEAGGRVLAANAAMALASGSHAAFLRAGDMLAEAALYEIAAALERQPDAGLVYGDDDEIDDSGRHRQPRFKSGFSPELLLEEDFLDGLTFYRLDLLRRLGGLRGDVEGAEFYDLALRAAATGCPAGHVPAILLHRRPTASTAQPKAAARVRCDLLASQGLAATPVPDDEEGKVDWSVEPWPTVSVVVPTRDRAELLERCLDGLLTRTDYPSLQVLVVDNESREDRTRTLLERISRDPRVSVLPFAGPFNWSAMNNRAARAAVGDIVLLLNNDVEIIDARWLRAMVRQAVRPGIGAVGAKLLFADRTIQHAGIWLGPSARARHLLRLSAPGDPGYLGQLSRTRNLSAVTGACLAVRRSVFEEAGGFDERFAVSYNDVDFCLRLQERGYRIVWTPHAELLHLESASRGTEASANRQAAAAAEAALLRERWGRRLDEDPFFNPNLDLIGEETLALASPPRRTRPWLAVPLASR